MRSKQTGVTLPELIIVIVIIGILAAITVPSFSRMLEKNRIKEAAENIKSDLHWARTQARKQNEGVTFTVTTGANWQYVISSTSAGTMKTVTSTSSAVSMTSTTFAANAITFDSRRGEGNDTDTADDNVLFSTTNYRLRVEIEDGWNIRICSPVAANAVGGYESC